jgi:hypothetical protein
VAFSYATSFDVADTIPWSTIGCLARLRGAEEVTDDDGRIRALEAALASERANHQATLNEVGRLAHYVERVTTSLNSLRKQFTAFVEEDRLARNMQFAQTALIDVRAQRDRQFGHYASVRRGTIGMLQAMDAGIVTESSLRQAAERLMIDTPGYWLAPAQVALAAWISDSEELARRALLEAMSREPNKTSLFFSLVLARHERYNATAQWMHEYVSRQDPMALSREFTVVLDAVAQGALGGRALQLIKERCVTWYEQLRSAEDIVQEQSLRWLRRMSRNQRKLADQFGVLPHLCPDWEGVAQWLEAATVHEQTEHWLRAQLETTVVRRDGLRARVDGVLRNLVTAYDEDEDSLRQQEMKWASVIEHWGNHAGAAQTQEDDSVADEPQADFLALLTTIGITPEKTGASIITRQLAIRLANEWIVTAADELSAKSRRDKPPSIKVRIGQWRGELRPGGSDDQVARSFTDFIDREVRDEVSQVTILRPVRVFVTAWAVLIVSVLALVFRWLPFALLLTVGAITLVLLVGSFIWLGRSIRVLPERRDEVRSQGEARKQTGVADLRRAADEARRAFQLWETELAKESSLVDFIREQASQTDPLSVPAIEARGPASSSAEANRPATELLIDPARNAERQPGADHSFAFKLPNWDLLPPPRIGGTTTR